MPFNNLGYDGTSVKILSDPSGAGSTLFMVIDAVSAVKPTTTITVGGATGKHCAMRYDTSALPNSDITIVDAYAALTLDTQASNPQAWWIWASEFSTPIVDTDYVAEDANYDAYSNVSRAEGSSKGIRVPIAQIFSSSATNGTTASVTIPARFINNGGNTDLELRTAPGVAEVSNANTSTVFYGPDDATNYPFLNLTYLSDADLIGPNDYRDVAIGSESFVGFGRETYPGAAVKPNVLLDMYQASLDGYGVNIEGKAANRNRARPYKTAVGRSGAGGTVRFDVTPEKCSRILPGIVKRIQTIDANSVSDLTGSPSVAPYTSYFKIGSKKDMASFTFIKSEGIFRYVYPGSYINSLTFDLVMDDVVSCEVSCQSLDEWAYDTTAAAPDDSYLLDPAAAYDTVDNGLLSFVDATVLLNNTDVGDYVQSATIQFVQGVKERRGLSGRRRPSGHFVLGFRVNVTFRMYFENEFELRAAMGDVGRGFPYKAQKNIVFRKVELQMAGSAGATSQLWDFIIPKMAYLSTRKTGQGADSEIYLECTGVANYNASGTTNDTSGGNSTVQVAVTNSESPSAYAASTNRIFILPDGETGSVS